MWIAHAKLHVLIIAVPLQMFIVLKKLFQTSDRQVSHVYYKYNSVYDTESVKQI